jgi:hypothetical protein
VRHDRSRAKMCLSQPRASRWRALDVALSGGITSWTKTSRERPSCAEWQVRERVGSPRLPVTYRQATTFSATCCTGVARSVWMSAREEFRIGSRRVQQRPCPRIRSPQGPLWTPVGFPGCGENAGNPVEPASGDGASHYHLSWRGHREARSQPGDVGAGGFKSEGGLVGLRHAISLTRTVSLTT